MRSVFGDADEWFTATRLGRIAATLVIMIVVSGGGLVVDRASTGVSDVRVPGATIEESIGYRLWWRCGGMGLWR